MGVMSCHRKDCESIMCRTYVKDAGYICYECQCEFGNKYAGRQLTKTKYLKKLIKFMKSKKLTEDNGENLDVHEFFRTHDLE